MTRRKLSLLLGLGLGIAAAPTAIRGNYCTWLMIAGLRQPLPVPFAGDRLHVEDVEFLTSDGVGLQGWFAHRAADGGGTAPAVVFAHGWPWNRAGNRARNTWIPDRDVDLLAPARALVEAGFHVLLFDLRNHGTSDTRLPVTFGVHEARDVAAAVAWLRTRPEVDPARLGAIGYSMGANAVLYGIPVCQPVRAAVAVQPVRLETFARNFARQVLGPPGPALLSLVKRLHQAFGSPPLDEIDPTRIASDLGETAVLYIQGSGDGWGSPAEVEAMVERTPNARPLVLVPSTERYGGYRYPAEHPDQIVAFFQEHLAP